MNNLFKSNLFKYVGAIKRWQLNKLISIHKLVKVLNIVILVISGAMFFQNETGTLELPDFTRYSDWDIWIWTIVLNSLALVQLITLVQCDCKNAYRWSNIILMLSGFVLLIVGCLFGLKYPPHNWQMTIYPFVGILFSIAGRQLNKVDPIKRIDNGKIN